MPLHVPQPEERSRELALEGTVTSGFARETAEILTGGPHHQLTGTRRTWHVHDLVVHVEHERVREPPDVVEAAFGPGLRLGCDRRLPQYGRDSGGCQQQNGGRDADGERVSPQERPGQVGRVTRTGGDSMLRTVAPEVVEHLMGDKKDAIGYDTSCLSRRLEWTREIPCPPYFATRWR